MNIMTIGSALEDAIAQTENQKTILLETQKGEMHFLAFQEGEKIEVQSLHTAQGGGAVNTSLSFTALGHNTTLVAKVGTDPRGTSIINELEKRKITTTYITKDSERPTGFSFIIPSQATGNRIVFVTRGATKHLEIKDIPCELLKKQDILYIAPLTGSTKHILDDVTAEAKKRNCTIAHNPSSEELRDASFKNSLKNISILLVNKEEASLLASTLTKKDVSLTDDFQSFFDMVHTYGPHTIVVTHGKHGAYASDGTSIYKQKSIAPQKISNTLGAGDAFCSTFVAFYCKNNDMKKALLYAAINASSVISHPDANTGLLTEKELETKANIL